MGREDDRDDVTLDEVAARLGSPHRFPWLEIDEGRLLEFVAQAIGRGCGVTFGAMGYGVLGSVRVRTPDDRTWSASYHQADELNDDLRLLSSDAGIQWVLDHAEKPRPRRR